MPAVANPSNLPLSRAVACFIDDGTGAGLIKADTVEKVSFKPNPNRKPLYGAEGFLTLTTGAIESDVSVSGHYLVAKSRVDWLTACIQQNTMQFATVIGGQAVPLKCGITDLSIESDSQSGEVSFSCTLKGGKPILQSYGIQV